MLATFSHVSPTTLFEPICCKHNVNVWNYLPDEISSFLSKEWGVFGGCICVCTWTEVWACVPKYANWASLLMSASVSLIPGECNGATPNKSHLKLPHPERLRGVNAAASLRRERTSSVKVRDTMSYCAGLQRDTQPVPASFLDVRRRRRPVHPSPPPPLLPRWK